LTKYFSNQITSFTFKKIDNNSHILSENLFQVFQENKYFIDIFETIFRTLIEVLYQYGAGLMADT
jgi:hypothetical protein